MLPAEHWVPWLDRALTDQRRLRALLEPIATDDDLVITPVSTAVNSSANDGPHLLQPTLQERTTLLS
jgi:putative SOS response-associated peptidase YedK